QAGLTRVGENTHQAAGYPVVEHTEATTNGTLACSAKNKVTWAAAKARTVGEGSARSEIGLVGIEPSRSMVDLTTRHKADQRGHIGRHAVLHIRDAVRKPLAEFHIGNHLKSVLLVRHCRVAVANARRHSEIGCQAEGVLDIAFIFGVDIPADLRRSKRDDVAVEIELVRCTRTADNTQYVHHCAKIRIERAGS